VTTKMAPEEAPADRSREQEIIRRATNRSQKIGAPETVRPGGKFATLSEALEHFERSRARTIQYVESCNSDLRAVAATHPVLGKATGQEFMLILALHPARHALQILELREALGLD
jgi:hypothetical protein